jgi:uncharacterized protein with HEPN domain
MRNPQDNKAYLLHIKDASEKILAYTASHNYNNFKENEWDQDAVLRNLEIIGEATNNIEDNFLKQYPEVPWRTIVNLRNVLIHDYVDVDLNVIWQIITKDLPLFYKQITDILNK